MEYLEVGLGMGLGVGSGDDQQVRPGELHVQMRAQVRGGPDRGCGHQEGAKEHD